MKKRKSVLLAAAALLFTFCIAPAIAQSNRPVQIPFRSVNPSYSAIKAAIDAQAPGHGVGLPNTHPFAPIIGPSWQGQAATAFSPSDATGAIGPTEYINVANISLGVYDRTGALLSSNVQGTLTRFPYTAGDGEVMWSPGDSRFYASFIQFNFTGPNGPCQNPTTGAPFCLLIYGFSKTSAPSASPSDWCFYQSSFGGRYGSNLPDYPKLGLTADFILIGVNVFDSTNNFNYVGSDVAWAVKPPAGSITVCPSEPTEGVKTALNNADGTLASTPVPANQADSNSAGAVIANEDPGGGTSTVLSLFRVSKNKTTGKAIFSKATSVNVAGYAYPPSAAQPCSDTGVCGLTLETLDARLTNAIQAVDPRLKTTVIWTQHTVAASGKGLGSEVRWYEINKSTGALLQNGIVNSSTDYCFMGAISPNRNGTLHKFGSNMVVGFNTSSLTDLPAAQMVSKIEANPQSGFVLVQRSVDADQDFTCFASGGGPPCRWGDYSGASPDPASSSGNVWLTVMLEGNDHNNVPPGGPWWITWNWEATP
jgi:hypothetical protein